MFLQDIELHLVIRVVIGHAVAAFVLHLDEEQVVHAHLVAQITEHQLAEKGLTHLLCDLFLQVLDDVCMTNRVFQ